MLKVQRIVPNLWFDGHAEEAAKYYAKVFPNSKIIRTSKYPSVGQEIHKHKEGTTLTVEFELEGQRFVAINGGPEFKFNEAVSFVVYCYTQEEIDYYWDKLTADGDPSSQQCGWLKDKFGVSWQIVPIELMDMITDHDSERVGRVVSAYLPMKKFDLETLRQAFEGKREMSMSDDL